MDVTTGLEAGKTYKAKVRVYDATMENYKDSTEIEFTTDSAINPPIVVMKRVASGGIMGLYYATITVTPGENAELDWENCECKVLNTGVTISLSQLNEESWETLDSVRTWEVTENFTVTPATGTGALNYYNAPCYIALKLVDVYGKCYFYISDFGIGKESNN